MVNFGPTPKRAYEESKVISDSFDLSTKNKSKEVISKWVLTHILKLWYEIKNQYYLISTYMSSF